jgi:CSLREA domain-containing protein
MTHRRFSLASPMVQFARIGLSALLVLALFGILPSRPTVTYAAAIVVNSTSDAQANDSVCTLREAITNANADAQTAADCPAGNGADTITFNIAASATISLTAQLPPINSPITITGPGSDALTLSGNETARILSVNSAGRLTLSGVTLQGGQVNGTAGANPGSNGGVAQGGAIFNAGTLQLNDVVFLNNRVIGANGTPNTVADPVGAGGDGQGGALYNSGTGVLTATLVIFENNQATGGNGAAGVTGTAAAAGPGGIGGGGLGGAFYNAGRATLSEINAISNTSQGGNGGNGGASEAFAPANGGRGGDGLGGVINNTGVLTITDSSFEENETLGGNGGTGGTTAAALAGGNGGAGGTAQGGAIRNANGTLYLNNVSIQTNNALGGLGGQGGNGAPGGNGGTGGVGQGGAIRTNGRTTIENSTIQATEARGNLGGQGGQGLLTNNGGNGGNGGVGQGGGLYAITVPTISAINSTFAANLALGGVGGNAGTAGGSGTSGVGGNGAPGQGGGLFVSTIFTATHLTISESEARGSTGGTGLTNGTAGVGTGGGTYLFTGANVAFYNSIIANSVRGGDCALAGGAISARNGTLVEDNSCGFSGGSDPQLAELGNYDGPTPVYGLPNTSPAIGFADQAFCAATDQRGLPRDNDCDSGAYENQAPFIGADEVTTPEDQPLAINLLSNAFDPDSFDTISLLSVGQPLTGTLALSDTIQVVYTPTLNFVGTDVFTYTVSDGVNGSTGSITVTVTPVNDLPTITPIFDQTTPFARATEPISFTIGDVETPASELTVVGGSSNVTLVPTANIVFSGDNAIRTVTITPTAGQNGTSTISIRVTDINGGERTITFVLTVSPPPNVYLPMVIR